MRLATDPVKEPPPPAPPKPPLPEPGEPPNPPLAIMLPETCVALELPPGVPDSSSSPPLPLTPTDTVIIFPGLTVRVPPRKPPPPPPPPPSSVPGV